MFGGCLQTTHPYLVPEGGAPPFQITCTLSYLVTVHYAVPDPVYLEEVCPYFLVCAVPSQFLGQFCNPLRSVGQRLKSCKFDAISVILIRSLENPQSGWNRFPSCLWMDVV